MIPCQRHLFDLPDDIAYLNCAYMAPLMHSVVEAGLRGVRRKARPWEIAAPDFFSDAALARELFARIVNARAEDIAIAPAASYGMTIAARNLPLRTGQTIVLLADQFPSNLYPWRAAAARAGAEIVTVDAPDGDLSAAVLAAIDERTAIAALPHCRWTDGALLDLESIGEHVRAAGGALALDLTQSAGALSHRLHESAARLCGVGLLQVADGALYAWIRLRPPGPSGRRAARVRLVAARGIRGLRAPR